MKITEITDWPLARAFVDDDDACYIRIGAGMPPLWCRATGEGFRHISGKRASELEGAFTRKVSGYAPIEEASK